ncbi:MAG: BRCT domain-containing protein [Syntrophobacterales bacterium]|jgi:endonuclease III
MEVISELLTRLGGKFSTELGITVAAGPEERQKWFLAAILLGAPISGLLASRTYRVMADQVVISPEAVLSRGWDGLVVLLDKGGYTRYDFKTATKLLAVMTTLKEKYQGDLERLAAAARDPVDLERRLQDLASGIGPTTVNIFLRELRGIWPLAQPHLSPLARLAADHLGLIPHDHPAELAWEALVAHWEAQPVTGFEVTDLEAALVRLGRDFCRKPAKPCPFKPWCKLEPSSPK